jgi:hypothetical protein
MHDLSIICKVYEYCAKKVQKIETNETHKYKYCIKYRLHVTHQQCTDIEVIFKKFNAVRIFINGNYA